MLSVQSRCRLGSSHHHPRWIVANAMVVATEATSARRGFLAATPALLRAGSDRHKPLPASRMREGTPMEGFTLGGIEPKPGARAVRTNPAPRDIESTVTKRDRMLRRGFGSKVSEEQLLVKNYEKTIKDGLHVNIEVDREYGPDDVPVGAPRQEKGGRFWQKPREQPLNPHYNMALYKPKVTPKRMRDGTTLNVSRDQLNHPHKMSTSQVYRVADKYASLQWYAPIWRVFRRFDLDRLKKMQNPAQILATVLFGCMGCIIYYLYMCEIDCYMQLDPVDQLDLNRLFMWMRMSDFKSIADEVMEEHDPLHVLCPREQLELVIAECRHRGLNELDPELAKRRYGSLVREPDYYHIFYWMTMYFGSVFGGGHIYWAGFERLNDERQGGGITRVALPPK